MLEGGGNCIEYLKRGWNRKEVRENKDFTKGGQAGSMGECLQKGKWPNRCGTGFPICGSEAQIHLAPRSTQSFKRVYQMSTRNSWGLSPFSGSAALRQLDLIHKKGPKVFF